MKLKKIISIMVSIIIIGYLITISFVNVSATQSRTDYFSKNYTLGNSQADNVAIIAEAQIGRTKAQMGYTENWCADFVADCGALAGVSNLIPANGVVSSLMNNIKNAGGYEVSSPQRGDIVFYYCTSCKSYVHTGVMLDSVYSAEGNVGGKVQKLHANYKDSNGHTVDSGTITRKFVRPNYVTNRDPLGSFDGISADYNKIYISGWTFDPDNTSAQLWVHVYIGGEAGNSNAECVSVDLSGNNIYANTLRSDVDDVYHCGAWHGFATWIPTSKKGEQPVYIYAINSEGGNNPCIGSHTVNIPSDTEDPVISNIRVSNITRLGYTVACDISDNIKIGKVEFPTWTINNGQDDLIWHLYSENVNSNTVRAWYRVKISEHNSEQGEYITHIYAYDQAGNKAIYKLGAINVMPAYDYIPTDVFEYNGNIYAIYDNPMAWTEAEEQCRLMEGHLATISDAEENDAITSHLGNHYYWIGLNDVAAENDFKWSNGENRTYTNWEQGQPDNAWNGENYVHLYGDGKWNDASNDPYVSLLGDEKEFGFILEIENSSIQIYKTDYYGTSKYEFYNANMPYSVAKFYAKSKGGDLPVINSAEENSFINKNQNGWYSWIDLVKDEDSEGFTWSSGNSPIYENWNSNEPDNNQGIERNTVMESGNGKWNDTSNKFNGNLIIKYDNYYGDIDGNGKINDVDATLLLKHISGISKLNNEQLSRADVHTDSKIDMLDVIAIQNKYTNINNEHHETISSWTLASNVPAGAEIVDKKYTYNLTSYTTSGSSSLSGWTQYNSSWVWGDYGGWSGWQDGYIDGSESRQVDTQSVVESSNYKTIYVYHRWTSGSADSGSTCSWDTGYDHIYKFDYPLTILENSNWNGHTTYRYYYTAATGNTRSGSYKVVIYSGTEQQWLSDNYKTQYRYRDRDKIYTYYFTKTENKESSSYPSGDNISNIQEYVKYKM